MRPLQALTCAVVAVATSLGLTGCSVSIGNTAPSETAVAGFAIRMDGPKRKRSNTTTLRPVTAKSTTVSSSAASTSTVLPTTTPPSTVPPTTAWPTTARSTTEAGVGVTVESTAPPRLAEAETEGTISTNSSSSTTSTATTETRVTSSSTASSTTSLTTTTRTSTITSSSSTSTVSSSSTSTSTSTSTSARRDGTFACESEEYFWGLEAMESKGLCLDDVSFRDCADGLPSVWPNTKFSPVKTLRLYRPWDSSWGSEYLRTKAWTKLANWVKQNNVKVVLGTEVTCNEMDDEEMWFWNVELMKLLGKDHVMGVAVGNEMDMFRATGASEETACSDELWESRYWDTLKRRVNDLDLNGFVDTKVTAVWSMGVLGAVETPFKEDGTAKANTLVKKAYEKWPRRWVWTFNTYSIWDRSLWPTSTQECVQKTKEAVAMQPVESVLAEVRRRIKMITGNDDDPLWIGEIGWASPAPQSLSEALDVCPDFGSSTALRGAYKNFLAWDLSMDHGLKGPDHAFYYAIRDDPKRGSGFGLIGTCKERQCKIQKEGISSLKLKFV